MSKKTETYESSITRLNEIVRLLDAEETPLEESMKLYAEGIEIVEKCVRDLSEAQTRIKELRLRSDGVFETLDFDEV
ncbi:MAG: exodeoxyribonuclease VII small subunit [Bacteroidota bacterium]|jgi:exodeoxyribonuclease VII small subunit|nr:exodeoxyribonuclease VII small subunit [Bacteroidota bacterium]